MAEYTHATGDGPGGGGAGAVMTGALCGMGLVLVGLLMMWSVCGPALTMLNHTPASHPCRPIFTFTTHKRTHANERKIWAHHRHKCKRQRQWCHGLGDTLLSIATTNRPPELRDLVLEEIAYPLRQLTF